MSAERKEGQGRKCGGEKEQEVQFQAMCQTQAERLVGLQFYVKGFSGS